MNDAQTMPELATKERLQPSLLDRLTDEEPGKKVETGTSRALSPQQLRASIRRDLGWLLNNTHLAAVVDLDAYPEVARSTVNYGVPDLAGKTSSTVDVPALEEAIRTAIWEFEPRLLRDSVIVKAIVDDEQMSHNAMSFVIEARLWAQPVPLKVLLKTDLDLETGDIAISEPVPARE